MCILFRAFPGSSIGKESVYTAGDPGSIPGSGRPLEKEVATRSSILVWKILWATVHGVTRVGHYVATKTIILFRIFFIYNLIKLFY